MQYQQLQQQQQWLAATPGAIAGTTPTSSSASAARALSATLLSAQKQRMLAEGTLQSLQAAVAKVQTSASAGAGKENGSGAGSKALPPPPAAAYSHQRVSPGHFWVNPTRAPLQPQQQGSPATAAQHMGGHQPTADSGSSHGAAASTPLSQQSSHGGSPALVDSLVLRGMSKWGWSGR